MFEACYLIKDDASIVACGKVGTLYTYTEDNIYVENKPDFPAIVVVLAPWILGCEIMKFCDFDQIVPLNFFD